MYSMFADHSTLDTEHLYPGCPAQRSPGARSAAMKDLSKPPFLLVKTTFLQWVMMYRDPSREDGPMPSFRVSSNGIPTSCVLARTHSGGLHFRDNFTILLPECRCIRKLSQSTSGDQSGDILPPSAGKPGRNTGKVQQFAAKKLPW